MLIHSETFLKLNEDALKRLEVILEPEAFKIAVELAPKQDEDNVAQEEEEQPAT